MKLFRRRAACDFAAEIEAHLAIEADRLRSEGLSEAEARARASRAFGNVTAARESFHESRRSAALDALARDLRYAVRGLRRSPGFAAAAVLTLALGIGANTAIFSAIDEVLFRPPNVPAADRLVQVYSVQRKTSTYVSSSYPDYADLRGARSLEGLGAYVRLPLAVALDTSGAERISVDAVSGNYFGVLGVGPVLGRALAPEDDLPGAPPAAWIAEGLWRRRFGAGVAGRSITIEGRRFAIAGVMPDRFRDLNLNWATPPQMWIPLRAAAVVVPQFETARAFGNRAVTWLVLTGRLRHGVSIETAQAELQAIAEASNRDLTAAVLPLSRSKFWPAHRKRVGSSLAGFAIGAGLLLLLACANVSNLLLERAAARRREFAMRLAIGAGRRALLRQLLVESGVLALCGFAVGVAAAEILLRLLTQFPNAFGLPLSLDLRIDPRSLAVCGALSVSAVLLAGAAPVIAAMRLDVWPALKQPAGGGASWSHAILVAAQVAISMVLLVGGGIYGRTLWKAYEADLGFRADHLLTGEFSVPLSGPRALAQFRAAQREFLRQTSGIPGVAAASVSSHALLGPGRVKAQVRAADSTRSVDREIVGAGYFAAAGIGLAAGREFAARDDAASARVAIVNETLAAAIWPGENPLGRTLVIGAGSGMGTALTVVGVARTAKYASVWEEREPRLYLAAEQSEAPAAQFVIRSKTRPQELADAVRKTWAAAAPALPLYNVQTGEELVAGFLMPQRVAAGMLGGFGALALALTAVGLYSVVAVSVTRQRREIGVRMAIGAAPRSVLAEILRRAVRWLLAGVALGAISSVVAARVIAANVRDVSPRDPAVYAAATLLLAAVGVVAALIPALRAARVDPAEALRAE